MTTSDQIRALAGEGLTVSEIAGRLGIRYQHAYKVCRDAGLFTGRAGPSGEASRGVKPKLTVEQLLQSGFSKAGRWDVSGDRLVCPSGLPATGGVYAFAQRGTVVYIGLASRSLTQRLYFYGNPGPTQCTNIRLNEIIRAAAGRGEAVEVFFACPPQFEWNSLTVCGAEGLEAGLIRDFDLPWNMRGS
jgi:hypothetical protein